MSIHLSLRTLLQVKKGFGSDDCIGNEWYVLRRLMFFIGILLEPALAGINANIKSPLHLGTCHSLSICG